MARKIVGRVAAVFFLSACILSISMYFKFLFATPLHGENSNDVANDTDYTEEFNDTNNQDNYDATSFNGTDLKHEEANLIETSNNQQKEFRKDFNFRIVGGDEADAGEFPFMASWHRSFSSEPSCGGSLVSPNLVLTAAHCQGVSGGIRIGSINARGSYNGSPPGVEVDVTGEIPHPDYDDDTTAYDFMLLELDEDVDTDIYAPINLNFEPDKPSTGQSLTVIGFGTLESEGDQPDVLMKVTVPVVSYDTCSAQYNDLIDDIQLCAGFPEGGKDSCQGDSGGPIFRRINGELTQVGVVSFGRGCALPDFSGVYARVSGVSSWLKTQICNRSSEPKPLYCEDVQPSPLPPRPTSPPEYQPTPDCVDSPGWYDSDGPEYDCEWYAKDGSCENSGDCCQNDGKTANQACCACGGGSGSNGSITPAPVETGTCENSPRDWKDSDGDGCAWYAGDDRCEEYGDSPSNDGRTANEVCCACGGGSTGSNTPAPAESPFFNPTTDCTFSRITSHEKDFNSRIVGGTEADAGEFPFMASWHRSFSSKPSCGGSLVSPNLVLTAAHCQGISGGVRIGSINAIDFYSGSPRGVEADVTREIPHPDYDDSTTAYDFMLLELDTDIDTDIYTPINLNFNPNKPRTGQPLTVIGFGTLESGGDQPDTLMEVRVPAVSYETCSCQYDDIIDDIHLCAGIPEGGKDSCQGDSGGPIFRKLNGVTTQVGIVSFGQGCALPDSSGVYARLSGVSSWLKTQICNRSSEPKPLYCEDVGPSPLPPAPTSAPEYQPTPDCVDSPGWYDGDGPEYDCEWYASNNGCEDGGGDCCRNDGKTANEACCVCGGGSGSNGSITPAPAETGTCEDSPSDWKDIDEDDCTWYAQKDDRCDIFGSYSNNDGKSANEVCCVCGGGVER